MSSNGQYLQRFLSKQRVTCMENPDYATYAQVIATLFIALAIESGTGSLTSGASAPLPPTIEDRVRKEILRREVGWYGLLIALLVLVLDLLVLATSWSHDAIGAIQGWLVGSTLLSSAERHCSSSSGGVGSSPCSMKFAKLRTPGRQLMDVTPYNSRGMAVLTV
jgi:hypothetical protein